MTGVGQGRVVHYVYGNGDVYPCMIVRVHNDEGCVNLLEFNDKTMPYTRLHTSVNYSEEYKSGFWSWPKPA